MTSASSYIASADRNGHAAGATAAELADVRSPSAWLSKLGRLQLGCPWSTRAAAATRTSRCPRATRASVDQVRAARRHMSAASSRLLAGEPRPARATMTSFVVAVLSVWGRRRRSQPAREGAGQGRDHHPRHGHDHQHAQHKGAQRQRPPGHYGAERPENQCDDWPDPGPREKGHLVPRRGHGWSRAFLFVS
jgi:hypothetical protein